MDGLIGELHAAELIFRPDGFWENIRKRAEAGDERLPDGLLQDVVGKPGRQRIDWHEPPGDASGVLRGLENRILHLARRLLLQRAEEAVGLAVMERGGEVGLVEVDQMQAAGAVGDGQPCDLKALADIGGFRRGDDHGLKAGGDAGSREPISAMRVRSS